MIVAACLWALLLWVQLVKYLPALRAITGCRHTRGKLRETVPGRTGKYTALTWYCDNCEWQHQLPRLMRLPNGTWWLMDEKEVPPLEHPDDPTEGQGGEGGVRPEA